MKIRVEGYKDDRGLTEPVILAGSLVPMAEKMAIINDAKRYHKFPKGIKRIELVRSEDPLEVAVFINDETAKHLQSVEAAFKKAQAELEKKRAAEAKAKADAEVRAQEIKDAAATRNESLGKKHALETRIRNLSILPEGLRDKDHDKLIVSLKSELDGISKQAEKAVAAYDALIKETPAETNKSTTNKLHI